jgi:hypothetical protein
VSYFVGGIYEAVSSEIAISQSIILDIGKGKSVEITGGDALDYRVNCTLNLLLDGLGSAEHTPNFLINLERRTTKLSMARTCVGLP